MRHLLAEIEQVAPTDATVLISGESGTGKGRIARLIHRMSRRREGRLVTVNCAALPETLLESELFGHVKGAFTGATADRPGIFVQADGGTLFLDEVAELPMELQAKLLRVIQERVLVPVGGSKPRTVDVRIVAATHRSLRDEVRAGRFREDLMYRLRVVPLFLPSLRERPLDIELLLWHFIEDANARGPRRVMDVSPAAMRALLDHPWPGNVRELQNVVAYAFAVGRASTLDLDDLPPDLRATGTRPAPTVPAALPPRVLPPRPAPADPRAELEEALARAGGDLGEAARLLGVSRTTLWRRRRALGDD
jgi:transcriptional regulator with PAS, ATPase and Fis domain